MRSPSTGVENWDETGIHDSGRWEKSDGPNYEIQHFPDGKAD
jgi:hypothetical protein